MPILQILIILTQQIKVDALVGWVSDSVTQRNLSVYLAKIGDLIQSGQENYRCFSTVSMSK